MNEIKTSIEKLKQYFYNRFKDSDYKTTLLNLYNVEERERIINKLAENQEEAYFYNNIYETTLKNISKIFKNNDTYKKSKLQEKKPAREIQPKDKKHIPFIIINIIKTIFIKLFTFIKWLFVAIITLIYIILKDASKK